MTEGKFYSFWTASPLCWTFQGNLIAFVKERFHNAVEIDILGIFWRKFIVTPEKFFRGKFFRCKWRHCNLTFSSRIGAACFVCRVSWPFIRVWCASLLCGLLSSKLRCLHLKIELLAFWEPACLRRKKWPTWVCFGQLLAHLMILTCKHKHGLFCRDERWRVFVTWLGQLFIMFTITTSKHLGFYMLTVSSFISFAVFGLHFIKSVDQFQCGK